MATSPVENATVERGFSLMLHAKDKHANKLNDMNLDARLRLQDAAPAPGTSEEGRLIKNISRAYFLSSKRQPGRATGAAASHIARRTNSAAKKAAATERSQARRHGESNSEVMGAGGVGRTKLPTFVGCVCAQCNA